MADILASAVFCIVHAAISGEIKKEIAIRYENLPDYGFSEKTVQSD